MTEWTSLNLVTPQNLDLNLRGVNLNGYFHVYFDCQMINQIVILHLTIKNILHVGNYNLSNQI